MFILPKLDSRCGAPAGATTDLHYMVLPFISGTGKAVMCVILFKSDQNVSEFPINWKTGINITCDDIEDKETIMRGGPRETYSLLLRDFTQSQHHNFSFDGDAKYLDKFGVHERKGMGTTVG